MKTKLFGLLMLAVLTLFGCKEKEKEAEMVMEETEAPDSADFDKKVAVIRAFFQAHGDEDIEAQSALLADDMKWSPPAYNGNQWLGKGELVEALKGYHEGFDNIKYHEGIVMPDSTANGFWSGSVFPGQNANASAAVIRVYGTWTATHTESGKEIGVKFFNLSSVNDDGKIVQSSDYFDVHGLAAQLEEEE
ncbi:MAG: nuclear transport factor 2 family protein [Eudoraea sp.]|uniref:nuclear transport factor 2 family protein n=1 Tax=Eudoraea sp. TaxID=1979955 RepID=UPI00326310D4